MSTQVQARSEVEALLVAKSQADLAFRQALLKNPKAAIEKEFGVTLPAAPGLRVVEETASTNYLVLPATIGDELSEAELEAVGGGWWSFGGLAQSRSDIGQKLQFQLNEANNIYQR